MPPCTVAWQLPQCGNCVRLLNATETPTTTAARAGAGERCFLSLAPGNPRLAGGISRMFSQVWCGSLRCKWRS